MKVALTGQHWDEIMIPQLSDVMNFILYTVCNRFTGR